MASSHHCEFAVTERPSLGNHVIRCQWLVVLLIISFVPEPVSAPQRKDVSWILVDSGSSMYAGMNRNIEFLGTKQVRCQPSNQTTAMIKWDVATVRFPIASVRRLTMQGNKSGLRGGALLHRKQERDEDGVGGTRHLLLAETEDLDWWRGQQVAVHH